MLLMKLDTNDLQFEHFRHFDGQYAYAQNKVHSINVCVCLGYKWNRSGIVAPLVLA